MVNDIAKLTGLWSCNENILVDIFSGGLSLSWGLVTLIHSDQPAIYEQIRIGPANLTHVVGQLLNLPSVGRSLVGFPLNHWSVFGYYKLP